MRSRTYLLVLIFIGLLVFFQSLFNGFLSDDLLQITRNLQVHSLGNIFHFFTSSTYETAGNSVNGGLFYRPMMMVMYTVLYSLGGQNPFFFHLFQLVLHITNGILVFYFFKKFFKEEVAFITAIFFIVHPINVEAVVYAANMQEVLFFFFGMLALLSIDLKDLKNKIYLVFIFQALSLFSKETGLLFLVMSVIYIWQFAKNKKDMPLFVAGEAVIFGIYIFLRNGVAHINSLHASIAPIANTPFPIRLLQIPAIISYYLKTCFFPVQLGIAQNWVFSSITFQHFYLPLIASLLFFTCLYLIYKRISQKNKKDTSLFIFFSIWFIFGLLLHLQFIALDQTVADRWFYFPFVGLEGMLAIVVYHLYTVVKEKRLFIIVLVGIILILSLRSFIRVQDWQDDLTLYSADIHTVPQNYILDNYYGSALINNDQFDDAKPYIIRSVKQYPFSVNLNNLAIIYTAEKNYPAAEKQFKGAIKRNDSFFIYENYANFLFYYESPKTALTFTKQALKKFPTSPNLWLTLAKAEYELGDKKSALVAVQKSMLLQPSDDTQKIYSIMKSGKELPTIKK